MIDDKAKEKILNADLSNIVRQVKAGKPLSAAQRKLIEKTADQTAAGKLFDSMGQAAAAIGVELELLKRAKRLGCPAFKPGGRVDGAKFRAWIAANSELLHQAGEDLSLKDQKIQIEIRKLKRIEDTADRILVKKAEVAAAIRRVLASVAQISESKLVNEWPNAVAGLDVPQARVYGKRLHDAIMADCQKLAEEFPE